MELGIQMLKFLQRINLHIISVLVDFLHIMLIVNEDVMNKAALLIEAIKPSIHVLFYIYLRYQQRRCKVSLFNKIILS